MNGKEVACRWGEYIKAINPTDPEFILVEDSNGYCLFHSEDKGWKIEHDFYQSFIVLFQYLLEDERHDQLVFHNFHFVGIELPKAINERLISFEKMIITKPVLIYDSVFHDELDLERLKFIDELYVAGCIFKNLVDVTNCEFSEEISIGDKCVFRRSLMFHNYNLFKSVFQFTDVTCHHNFSLESVIFKAAPLIENCEFKSVEEGVYFMAEFQKGISFRNNKTGGLLDFQESQFFGDSQISNYSRRTDFSIQESEIYGTLNFVGSEDQLMFSPNSVVEISDEQIKENGMVVFDYCNLLNLGQEFLLELNQLEVAEKIRVNETCEIDRFKVVYDYPYQELNDKIFEDLYRLIGRFFTHLFSTHLKVDIVRKTTTRQILVIYTTRMKIKNSEFLKRLEVATNYIVHCKPIEANYENRFDLIESRNSILKRLILKSEQNHLTNDEIKYLLSHKNAINIVNINELTMGDKNENKQKAFSFFGRIKQILNNEVKGNMKSEFKALFDVAVSEVNGNNNFTDDKKNEILEVLNDLKDKVENKKTVPKYLKDSLLSMTGSMASILSLLKSIA